MGLPHASHYPPLNSGQGAHLCHGTSVYGMLLADEFMCLWEQQFKNKVNLERLNRYCVDRGVGSVTEVALLCGHVSMFKTSTASYPLVACRLVDKYGCVPRFALDLPVSASEEGDFDELESALGNVDLDKVGTFAAIAH